MRSDQYQLPPAPQVSRVSFDTQAIQLPMYIGSANPPAPRSGQWSRLPGAGVQEVEVLSQRHTADENGFAGLP